MRGAPTCFNEAAASNAAEIAIIEADHKPKDDASMRPRQVMPRRLNEWFSDATDEDLLQ